MKKFNTAFLICLTCSSWIGCDQSRTATLPDARDSASVATTETTSDDQSTALQSAPTTAQEVIQTVQAQLTTTGQEAPAIEDVEAAIAIGKEGRERFPHDENLTKALATLMYQSIRSFADKPEELVARRLELGDIARTLIENPESLEKLGNMPSFLLLEEAKGHIQNKELDKAWNSIVKSRDIGFKQPKILFLDPELDPVVQNKKYAAEMQTWLHDEIDKELSAHEPFPFQFSLKSLTEDDTEVSLTDFADKELTLVDLWGTWCGPCRAEVPHLVELQKKIQDRVAIVGINFEQPIGQAEFDETKKLLAEFQTLQPMNYPCVYGDFEPSEKINNFVGFPTMLLVDNKGVVRLVMMGYQPLPVLEATVERVLNYQTN